MPNNRRTYEDKNPVVIGRLGRDASKPTVTFYGRELQARLLC